VKLVEEFVHEPVEQLSSSPSSALPGVIDGTVVLSGVRSTEKVRSAGVGSALPSESMARTRNACPPWESADVVNGELQAVNDPLSRLHWKVAVSLAENWNVGVASRVVPVGPARSSCREV
jgi:hypothetical protein